MRKPKPEKIQCLKCKRKVSDTFTGRWEHLVAYHPEDVVNRLLPVIFNGEQLVHFGKQLAGDRG